MMKNKAIIDFNNRKLVINGHRIKLLNRNQVIVAKDNYSIKKNKSEEISLEAHMIGRIKKLYDVCFIKTNCL